MLNELKSISSTKKDLQNFCQVMAIACALIAGLLFWRQKDSWHIFAIAAAAFLFFRFTFPRLLLPLQKAWMALAVAMGWFVSRILLSVLYFIGFAGIGLIGRLFGKKFLEMKIDKNTDSYWIIKENKERDNSLYEKQF